jgi:hypothetical protein
MRLTIGVDIDGVIFPWEHVVTEVAAERFGVELGPMVTWDTFKQVLGRDAWDWLWTAEGSDLVFGQLDRVYPGAVEMVLDMLKAGHRVHFVTHRDPRRTGHLTAEYLRLHFGAHPWAGVHVLQNACRKCDLMTAPGWDVFVDDKPSTLNEMSAYTDAMLFCPARPWNRDVVSSQWCLRYDEPAEVTAWLWRHS